MPDLRGSRRRAPVLDGEHTEGRRGNGPSRQRRGWLLWRRVRLLPLSGFVARLTESVVARVALGAEDAGARRAAVAVVVTDEPDPALLFIRRRERAGDPWSGQMAFPGGYRAGPDEATIETARRETLEETGLDLAAARVVGVLDDVHPRTPFLPPLVVTPWVFLVSARAAVVPGAEADDALWIAVGDLFAPAHRGTFLLPVPARSREFPAIRVGPHVIWGLTERILAQVRDLGGLTG